MTGKKKTCLVTGASGFIGLKLCQALQNTGWHVLALVRSITDGPWHHYFRVDLLEELPIEAFLNTDVIFHLAGKTHALSETRQGKEEYNRINVEGTRNLLLQARQGEVRRFVFLSSIKAMGEESRDCLSEKADCMPKTSYGKSKLAAEQLVLKGNFIPESVVLRLSMVYGARKKGNLPRMIKAVSKGRFPSMPEVGNKRSMVHVNDVVQAALLAGTHPAAIGETYIITDGLSYSTRMIYEWICETLGKTVPRQQIPIGVLKTVAKAGDVIGRIRGRRFIIDTDALEKLIGSAWYSSEKIQRELGFKPKNNLRDSLPEIIAGMKVKNRL